MAISSILEEIKTLGPEELREVERTVRELLVHSTIEAKRESALNVLQESGLVAQVKRPSLASNNERPLVPIKGKPLSETIVEERR